MNVISKVYDRRIDLDCDYIDSDGTVEGLIKVLQSALDKVPAEYRNKATYSITSYDDSYSIEWSMYYMRPEFPAETKAREEQEAKYEEIRKQHKRLQFEALKRELGE